MIYIRPQSCTCAQNLSSVLCPKSRFSNRFRVDREFRGSKLVLKTHCVMQQAKHCLHTLPSMLNNNVLHEAEMWDFISGLIIKRGQENGNVLTLLFCQDYASKLKHFDSIMIAVG